MSNLLLISLFDSKNSYDCLGLASVLKNQNLTLLFSDQQLYITYVNYLITNNLHKVQLCSDSDISLVSLIKNVINQYEYFLFLKKTSIIINDLAFDFILKSVENHDIMNININNKIVGTIISKNYIIDTLNTTLRSLLNNTQNNPIIDITNYSKYIDKFMYQKIITKYISSPHIFYENDNCVFTIIGESKTHNLACSPCYINKKNNKTYNIDNNIIGKVLEYNLDHLTIEWSINGIIKVIKYQKNTTNKTYEEITII